LIKKPKNVKFRDLKIIEYNQAWSIQTELHNLLKTNKLESKKQSRTPNFEHHLLFAEHPHVYTLGKSGKMDHLLLNEDELSSKGASFFKINRGGDITYHGEGQITAYPILDLDDYYHDVHRYVRNLEEVVIRFLAMYELNAIRLESYTGVWLDVDGQKLKICAIGVHLSRWVTMHGLALNINTDLNFYKHIVPCGIVEPNTDVTSLAEMLGRRVDMDEAKSNLLKSFKDVFSF